MPGTGSPEGGNETGSEFRQKFEALQAENAALRTIAATNIAERYEYVKPEDLTGVSIEELPTKAEELQKERDSQRREIFTQTVQGLGWTEEQIQQALEGQAASAPAPQPASRMEVLGQIGGQPVRQQVDKSTMSPGDKIAAALAAEKK